MTHSARRFRHAVASDNQILRCFDFVKDEEVGWEFEGRIGPGGWSLYTHGNELSGPIEGGDGLSNLYICVPWGWVVV
jgi:hypothetical protein